MQCVVLVDLYECYRLMIVIYFFFSLFTYYSICYDYRIMYGHAHIWRSFLLFKLVLC